MHCENMIGVVVQRNFVVEIGGHSLEEFASIEGAVRAHERGIVRRDTPGRWLWTSDAALGEALENRRGEHLGATEILQKVVRGLNYGTFHRKRRGIDDGGITC
jgi:hypothetical protein